MSKKQCVVVFTRNNARIYYTDDVTRLHNLSNLIINPDLSYVDGTPPHFWKMDQGCLVPMNDQEKHQRILDIETTGIDNDPSQKEKVLAYEQKRHEEIEQEKISKQEEQKKIQSLVFYSGIIKNLVVGSYILSIALFLMNLFFLYKKIK